MLYFIKSLQRVQFLVLRFGRFMLSDNTKCIRRQSTDNKDYRYLWLKFYKNKQILFRYWFDFSIRFVEWYRQDVWWSILMQTAFNFISCIAHMENKTVLNKFAYREFILISKLKPVISNWIKKELDIWRVSFYILLYDTTRNVIRMAYKW